MCGIAGVIAPNGLEPCHLTAMASALRHRGPDGSGFALYSPGAGLHLTLNRPLPDERAGVDTVGLAHLRLSVLDLSAANSQPMADETRSYCLVYNGELYNYLEIKAELEQLGYQFGTTGDTEVVLHAYQAWGPDCLRRFNGMWALALLDAERGRIVFSRDRFGIKPIYYTVAGGALYFASEIKGLLAVPGMRCQPNERAVATFLLTGLADTGEETFFEGISQLPSAHWAEVSLSGGPVSMQPKPYWEIPNGAFRGSEQEAVSRFRDLLVDSVRLHAQSDVPVGTCLSGGLDSSSIVCASDLLRRRALIPRYTHAAFGYCSSDERFSEQRYMRMVADATAADMHYVKFDQAGFEAALPRIMSAQDEPFGSASIAAQWFVFQRAKAEGITVMLDGQGADEILAGYHSYFAVLGRLMLAHHAFTTYLALRAEYERDIGPFPLSQRALAQTLLPRWAFRLLRGARSWLRPGSAGTAPLSRALTPHLIRRCVPGQAGATSLSEALRADVRSLVLPALLRYEDRNSMAHSVEARVPFLDHRLVELAFALPDDWKIRGVRTKHILREAMRDILPGAVRERRDKVGFKSAPELTFGLVRRHERSLWANRTELERQWFSPEGVRDLLAGSDRSIEAEFALWRVVNTKLWARQVWGHEQLVPTNGRASV